MPAPYSADLRWRVMWFVMLSRGQLAVRKAVSEGSFYQTRRRQKRERHLKMSLRVSAIIFQLLKVIMPEKCALQTILKIKLELALGTRQN